MKLLVVRFSSIGDIVLTTPVLRALKQQLPKVEIHYLTKEVFKSVIEPNPHIDKIFTIQKSVGECTSQLKEESYDWIIDLHNNIRTRSLKSALRRPNKTLNKLNWKKWLLVRMKVDKLPDVHVVDRYFKTVEHLGVYPDGKPCEFPVTESQEQDVLRKFNLSSKSYKAIVVGAKFKTKRLPLEKVHDVVERLDGPLVLVGGPDDQDFASEIETKHGAKIINACGQVNLQGSAAIVKNASSVLTNDTGMMHIASAYNVNIVSVWGNTVPALGMFAYRPESQDSFSIHEVEGLSCRPCSKIGFDECPKGHFDCMMKQSVDDLVKAMD